MIEIGETVKVAGKQGAFRVMDLIHEEDVLLGYKVMDKRMMSRFYRVDVVKPKKKKKSRR